MNIGTDLRQVYENGLEETGSVTETQKILYDRCCEIFNNELRIAGKAKLIVG